MRPFGKYQLVRRLAAGGMAEVYLATGPNPRGDELIALKLILSHIAEDESFQSMFLQEARLTAALTHPNLVQVFDLGLDENRLYLAMEYIRGWPLSSVMKKAGERGKPMGAHLSAAVVKQACLGLHHAHEAKDIAGKPLGLVHRDISPHNLMIDQDGAIKVVDFGVAKATTQSEVSQVGMLKGKVGFMSPEQLKSQSLDRRADVYALGVVLFELATSQPFLSGKNDAQVLQQALFGAPPDLHKFGLPEAFVQLISKAIDHDRSKRFASAEEMAQALDEFLGTRGGRKELAELVGSLFPPLPATLREALDAAARDERLTSSLIIRNEAVSAPSSIPPMMPSSTSAFTSNERKSARIRLGDDDEDTTTSSAELPTRKPQPRISTEFSTGPTTPEMAMKQVVAAVLGPEPTVKADSEQPRIRKTPAAPLSTRSDPDDLRTRLERPSPAYAHAHPHPPSSSQSSSPTPPTVIDELRAVPRARPAQVTSPDSQEPEPPTRRSESVPIGGDDDDEREEPTLAGVKPQSLSRPPSQPRPISVPPRRLAPSGNPDGPPVLLPAKPSRSKPVIEVESLRPSDLDDDEPVEATISTVNTEPDKKLPRAPGPSIQVAWVVVSVAVVLVVALIGWWVFHDPRPAPNDGTHVDALR